jgi:hypothetical protein
LIDGIEDKQRLRLERPSTFDGRDMVRMRDVTSQSREQSGTGNKPSHSCTPTFLPDWRKTPNIPKYSCQLSPKGQCPIFLMVPYRQLTLQS